VAARLTFPRPYPGSQIRRDSPNDSRILIEVNELSQRNQAVGYLPKYWSNLEIDAESRENADHRQVANRLIHSFGGKLFP
jgi:hypothetical protein